MKKSGWLGGIFFVAGQVLIRQIFLFEWGFYHFWDRRSWLETSYLLLTECSELGRRVAAYDGTESKPRALKKKLKAFLSDPRINCASLKLTVRFSSLQWSSINLFPHSNWNFFLLPVPGSESLKSTNEKHVSSSFVLVQEKKKGSIGFHSLCLRFDLLLPGFN